MPVFTFSVSGNSNTIEPQSAHLPNARAACAEGVRYIGRKLEESPVSLINDKDWTVEITDNNGLLLMNVLISVSQSPAVTKT